MKMAVVYLAVDVAVGAFVSTVINFQILWWCVTWIAERALTSQEGH
jgi:large-conductance mechanosensitive channel